MTLTQMQYFFTVCQYENYTRAAERLYVSQPAVSQAIRELETECGTPLFYRRGNSLVTTPEGRTLYEEVSIVLRQMDRLGHVVKDLSLQRSFLRVGLSTFSGNAVFPSICRRFSVQHPEIELQTCEDTTRTLLYQLDEGQLDFALTTPNTELSRAQLESKYYFYPLKSLPMMFAVHREHPLAAQGRVSWEEIAAQPLVMLTDRFAPTRRIKKLFAEQGLHLHVIHYTTQMYTVERFVEQGAACGFLPGAVMEHNKDIAGLSYPVLPRGYSLMLIWKKQGQQASRRVMDYLIAAVRELYPLDRADLPQS